MHGGLATRAPAPAGRRALFARHTARGRSTRRWPCARWSCGARTTPGAACCTRPACCGCSATTTALDTRRRRVLRDQLERGSTCCAREASRRYPQIDFTTAFARCSSSRTPGISCARRACEDVVEHLTAEGGEYRQAAVAGPIVGDSRPLTHVVLADGKRLEADAFVFACGPWLSALFPDVVGANVSATRQEVFYFGTPAGDARFAGNELPVWMDFRRRHSVGSDLRHSGLWSSGFKVADDAPGPDIDPTSDDRTYSADGLAGRGHSCRAAFLRWRVRHSSRRKSASTKHAGRTFHRRPAPGRVECMDRWRRLRPRLQAGSRRRRDGRRPGARPGGA